MALPNGGCGYCSPGAAGRTALGRRTLRRVPPSNRIASTRLMHRCSVYQRVPWQARHHAPVGVGGPFPSRSVLIISDGRANDACYPIANQQPAAETDQNPADYPMPTKKPPCAPRPSRTKTASCEWRDGDVLPVGCSSCGEAQSPGVKLL